MSKLFSYFKNILILLLILIIFIDFYAIAVKDDYIEKLGDENRRLRRSIDFYKNYTQELLVGYFVLLNESQNISLSKFDVDGWYKIKFLRPFPLIERAKMYYIWGLMD